MSANGLALHQEPYWHNLLHFEDNRSNIITKSFFISPNGHVDAKAELEATIDAFIRYPNSTCRYPARYRWLNSKLKLNIKKPTCRDLDEFLEPNFKKIHLIFTAQRYDTPASVFGHTYLKVDGDIKTFALNYAAKIPDGINPISYIIGGLNGSYSSRFTMMNYVLKDYEYRSGEFRDLIEFELNLTKDEIKNIMLHLFEIKDTKEDYYFLSHNCSSELISLLDMAKYNSNLKSHLASATIPIETAYILEKEGYIKSIGVKKSKLKYFYNSLSLLNSKERSMLSKIVKHNYSINIFNRSDEFSLEEKKRIILSALLYFEVKVIKEGIDNSLMYPYIKLVKLQLKYNIDSTFDTLTPLKENPISNNFRKFYISTTLNEEGYKSSLIGYRHLFNNRFDMPSKTKQNGSAELFDIAITKNEDKIYLEYLTLLNIESSPISDSYFSISSDRLTIGARRILEERELYYYVDYALGYRYALSENFTTSIFATVGGYYRDSGVIYGSTESTLEYRYGGILIQELKLKGEIYRDEKVKIVELNNYFKISKESSLYIKLSQTIYEEELEEKIANIGLNFYF